MKDKKIILVYWYYYRKDLLLPFNKLQDQFEWHFILYRNKADETIFDLPYPIHYWDDFRTPYDLLDAIKPQAVIFMELSNLYAVSLNIAAKYNNILTFILDHGLKAYYQFYIDHQAANTTSIATKSNEPSKGSLKRKLQSLIFYFSCTGMKHLPQAFKLSKYLKQVYFGKSEKSLGEYKFKLRNANYYLLFSKKNLAYYEGRDGIEESDAIYFGNPFLDDLVHINTEKKDLFNPYYLLIDDGLLENYGISTTEKNVFLKNLNSAALEKGVPLYVKLHPAEYGRTDLYLHPNIKYIEHANLKELFQGSIAIFGISSVLTLPFIPKGEIQLFRIGGNRMQEELETWQVPFLDFFNFSPSDIYLGGAKMDPVAAEKFIEQYLYKNDANSITRLKDALLRKSIS